jgi:cell wall-associated NlpC family hydrolase
VTLRHHLATAVLAGVLTAGATALPIGPLAATASAQAPSGQTAIAAGAVAAQRSVGTGQFDANLGALAGHVAATLKLDRTRLISAWRSADSEHQKALVAALTQVGVPYRRNTSKPGVGFDCSGLTTFSWAHSGYQLYRQSAVQINKAAARTRATAQAGDLVYYPGHVMMYLGIDNAIVHAPFTGRNVEVSFISKKRVNSVRFGDPTG